MIELFNSYKNAGKISEALLVGRNIFNRNSGDMTVFDTYYDFLCFLRSSLVQFILGLVVGEWKSVLIILNRLFLLKKSRV